MRFESLGSKNHSDIEAQVEELSAEQVEGASTSPVEDPALVINEFAETLEKDDEIKRSEDGEAERLNEQEIIRVDPERLRSDLLSVIRNLDPGYGEDGLHTDDLIDDLVVKAISKGLDVSEMPELEDLWSTKQFLQGIALVTADSWRRSNLTQDKLDSESTMSEAEMDLTRNIRTRLFETLGIGPEEASDLVKQYWTRLPSRDKKNRVERIQIVSEIYKRNLLQMIRLDYQERGATRTLYRDYGIRHFTRYNTEHLVKQARGQVDEPLEVFLAATTDHNGFLDSARHNLATFAGGKEKSHRFVVLEASSLTESARRLVRVAKTHGPIVQLIVGAHGHKEHINIGPKKYIRQEDVEKSRGMKRLKERGVLAEDSQIILLSCRTGKRGGIAKEIHEATGAGVIASNRPVYGFSKGSRRKPKDGIGFRTTRRPKRKGGAKRYGSTWR